MRVERLIFENLIFNEEYSRKTFPFIKAEYFSESHDKLLFTLIGDFVDKYSVFPTKEALLVELKNTPNVSERDYTGCSNAIEELSNTHTNTLEWLVDTTETFCKDKAITNALLKAIHINDDTSGSESRGAIPQILTDALAVSFDTAIGHDFFEDADTRFEGYLSSVNRIPFDIDILNQATGGGLPCKTLNVLMASTGVGKSLAMCHFAGGHLAMGKDVLYITLELSESEVSKRIEANLLDTQMNSLEYMDRKIRRRRLEKLKASSGRLIVKEYPTSSAGSNHFRHLLNELRIKKNFTPDVIYVDYINICASSRIKLNNAGSTYNYVKAIAEEVRGLAVEFDVPIVTATQTNRSGYQNLDVDLSNTAESFGLPATADWMVALISDKELAASQQIMFKQLKSRYGSIDKTDRFFVGIDKEKMKLYEVESHAQDTLNNNTASQNQDPKHNFGTLNGW